MKYDTVGGQLPGMFAYYGEKQIDLSGLTSGGQILSVLSMEIDLMTDDDKIIVLAVK